jgi:hypothetical protein
MIFSYCILVFFAVFRLDNNGNFTVNNANNVLCIIVQVFLLTILEIGASGCLHMQNVKNLDKTNQLRCR